MSINYRCIITPIKELRSFFVTPASALAAGTDSIGRGISQVRRPVAENRWSKAGFWGSETKTGGIGSNDATRSSNSKVGVQFIVTGVPKGSDHRLSEEVKDEWVRVNLHILTLSALWKHKGVGIETTILERMFVATTQLSDSAPTPNSRHLQILPWVTSAYDENRAKYSRVVCPVEERTNLKNSI